ncbi:MAG: ROK family transcriptional regulator [Ruminococcaceae bacterium]|nr:ROK family transcriptional regulator [Oscillospiraceae bacterium]
MKKYLNLEDMSHTNCSNVLNIIQQNGFVSRKEITDMTGLSWGGMTKIVNRLLENGYIIETKQKNPSKSGRTPSSISINTKTNFVVGLDINKTGLKAIVMNLSGEVLRDYKTPVYSNQKDEMLSEIISFVSKIFDDFKSGEIITIGVAMQGTVDAKNGISVKFPGIKNWQDVPLKNILSKQFHVNTFIEHDPDCLLYPLLERKTENRLLLRIDKSIGMAVSIKNKIVSDKGIFEIAHNVVVPEGKPCTCGLKGCAEAYVLPCLENNMPNKAAIDEFIPVLAVVIKNMVSLFNISTVILTGELMRHYKLFEDFLFKKMADLNCGVHVVFLNEGNYAVQGAALIAIRKSINSLII